MSTTSETPKGGFFRFRKAGRRLAAERDGVAAIEFAALALPFFLLVFAIIETSINFAAQQVLANALDDAARRVRTGNAQGITEADLKAAVCDSLIMMSSSGCRDYLFVDLRPYTSFQEAARDGFTVVGDGDIKITSNGATKDLEVTPGGPGAINTLRIFYKWPVITDIMRKYMSSIDGGSRTLLYATTTWRNEPFNPSGS